MLRVSKFFVLHCRLLKSLLRLSSSAPIVDLPTLLLHPPPRPMPALSLPMVLHKYSGIYSVATCHNLQDCCEYITVPFFLLASFVPSPLSLSQLTYLNHQYLTYIIVVVKLSGSFLVLLYCTHRNKYEAAVVFMYCVGLPFLHL